MLRRSQWFCRRPSNAAPKSVVLSASPMAWKLNLAGGWVGGGGWVS